MGHRCGGRLAAGVIAVTCSVAVLTTACTARPGPADGPLAVPSAAVPGLPPCGSTPTALVDAPEVPGLVLPDGATVTSVTEQEPLVQVLGYVPTSPAAVRATYAGTAGLTVLLSEDEVVEAEILFTDGTYRTFVKAQAVCATGSQFIAVVAPEAAAGAVPTPAGGASPGA